MLTQRKAQADQFDDATRPLTITRDRIELEPEEREFLPVPPKVPTSSHLGLDKFPEEIVEYVFQVWAFICDRSPKRTESFCLDPTSVNLDHVSFQPYEGFVISYSTVAMWARKYKWSERADRIYREIIPDVWEQTARTTLMGAHEGVKWLRQVANGEVALTREDRTRVEAVKILADRSGFLPWSRQSFEQPQGPKQDFQGLVSGMEDDEIAKDLFDNAVRQFKEQQ